MALTKVTYSMIQDAAVNVRDFGASSSASAAANLTAFQAAVTATPVGGTLFIPTDASTYVIDTSGGLSAAIEINKRMTIWLEGTLRPSFQAIQANPPTIFYITANYVTLTGTGILKGDGTTNSVNTGNDSTVPSLIRVTGDYFTMTGLTVDTPFKVGVHLVGSDNSKITENNFTGGPTTYTDTAYFGIRISNGNRNIVSNNQFFPSATGGMYVQCIFTSNGNQSIFEGNVAHKPYEKLVYLNGSYNIVNGNTVIGNSSTIPGTNQTGTVGVVYRCDGAYNKITNNFSNYGGGAAARFGGGNDISGNTFLNCGQGAIAIFSGTSAFDATTVCNNICICGNLPGVYITDGIYISADVGTSKQFVVSNNIVNGFAPADPVVNIPVWQANTAYALAVVKPTSPNGFYYIATNAGTSGATEPTWPTSSGLTVVDGTITWVAQQVSLSTGSIRIVGQLNQEVMISNNSISNTRIGIVTDYMENSMVCNNQIFVSAQGLIEFNAANNQYRYNRVEGTVSVGIGSVSASTRGEGNTYNGTDIVADVTVAGGTDAYVVPNTTLNVASNAYVMVTAANDDAAIFLKDHGIYTSVLPPNVTIRSGDSTLYAGTEVFRVHLIQ